MTPPGPIGTICPMCGAIADPGARRCLSCGEKLRLSDLDIDRVRRQLKKWVLGRTVTSAAILFVPAFVVTQPSFGMGGTNYLGAALIAAVAAAMVGILLAARAYLHLQQLVAENAGSTLWYSLGRRLRERVTRRTF